MSQFTITGEGLQEYLAQKAEIIVVGEYGSGHHREVRYHAVSGEYQVYDHGEMTLATTDPATAATKFNGIRPQRD
jgi:hypothetical protein